MASLPRILPLVLIGGIVFAGFLTSSHSQDAVQKRAPKFDKPQKPRPTVDYNAPDPTDFDALKRKQIKANRYDRIFRQPIEDTSESFYRSIDTHWYLETSALPASESDVVVLGTVLTASAALSNDKSMIFSDYRIKVEGVLKGDVQEKEIFGERSGGRVKFPSGGSLEQKIVAQGFPQVGSQYLFFLKRFEADNYKIVTAYQMGTTIAPLDGSSAGGGDKYAFDKYSGLDASSFIQLVKDAIRQPTN